MRNVLRVWTFLVVGASLGMTFLWVTPANAIPLSNTQISWGTFTSFADISLPVVPPLIDYFDFFPQTPGSDGEIYSAVFQGHGAAAGKFVYVYQVYHYSTSSAANFSGIAFQAFTTVVPVNVPGVGTSFYIAPVPGDPITPPIGTTANSWGNYKPSEVDWSSNPPGSDISVSYIGANRIPRDGVSYFFGFVHSPPPKKVESNPIDAGPDLLKPFVYTPSPEPSAFILLSAGLLGLMAIRRRYLS